MGTFILKRKSFTVYDDTDRLKRMKDSDILAEQQKRKVGYEDTAIRTGTGAVIGAVGLTLLRRGKGGFTNNLKTGAKIGGAIGAVSGLRRRAAQNQDVNTYNSRLEYAQRQAARRERADWTANMTQRQGYSY